MAFLDKTNCVIDPKSGGVIFKGSPELRAVNDIKYQIQSLNIKMDMILELLRGVVENGGKMETSRHSQNNDSKI